ncbi:hypothetical protein KGF57_004637 [Candida theae]|uniref:Hyphally-regulated cell wall protein N-terminal domain-containing protein n=1 Tax=Candida theae TaxID=1198502 RepID=A0AAD5BBY5_9ASCO|nr:uncharacterized protein KGF57_004637 [Candida theae]KAI5949814.1 hypothetical protein KGF57_004637 [Candida theae]
MATGPKFNIGKGYIKSKFAVVDLNIVELNYVSKGAIAYNGPVPQSNSHAQCQVCKLAPVDPGTKPTQVLTTVTHTSNGIVSEQTRVLNIQIDDDGMFEYETLAYTPAESSATSTSVTTLSSSVPARWANTTSSQSSTLFSSSYNTIESVAETETLSSYYSVETEANSSSEAQALTTDYASSSIMSVDSSSKNLAGSLSQFSSQISSIIFEASTVNNSDISGAYTEQPIITTDYPSSGARFVSMDPNSFTSIASSSTSDLLNSMASSGGEQESSMASSTIGSIQSINLEESLSYSISVTGVNSATTSNATFVESFAETSALSSANISSVSSAIDIGSYEQSTSSLIANFRYMSSSDMLTQPAATLMETESYHIV